MAASALSASCVASLAHAEEPAGDKIPPRSSGTGELFRLFSAVDWQEFDRLRTGLDPGRIELDTAESESTDAFTLVAWLYEQQPTIFDLEQLLRMRNVQWPARCESCPVTDPRDANISNWMRSFSTLLAFDGQRCAAEDDWDGWAHRVALQSRLAAALLAQEDLILPVVGWGALERVSTALTTVSRLGYGHRFSPRSLQELRAALGLIDSDDPGRYRGRWFAMIEPRLMRFQQVIGSGDPSNGYTRLAREHLALNALFPDIPLDFNTPDEARQTRDRTLARVETIPDEQVLRGLDHANALTRRVAAAFAKGDGEAIRAIAAEADQEPSGVVRLLWELPPRPYWDFCERNRAAIVQATDAAESLARSH
jgi:hypothetical protein